MNNQQKEELLKRFRDEFDGIIVECDPGEYYFEKIPELNGVEDFLISEVERAYFQGYGKGIADNEFMNIDRKEDK